MLTAELDATTFFRNVHKTSQNVPEAMVKALRVQGGAIAGFALRHGPEDTMRWKRAVAMAANQAGAGPGGVGLWPVPKLQESQSFWTYQHIGDLFKNLKIAIKAYSYWHGLNRIYLVTRGSRTRPDRTKEPYYRRVVRPKFNFWKRRLKSAKRQVDEYRRSQREGAPAIFIGAGKRTREEIVAKELVRSGETQKIVSTRTITTLVRSRATSIRVNAPGGAGRVEMGPKQAFLVLHNKEPHATFVQKNTRIMTDAYQIVKQKMNVRRTTRRAYLRAVGDGTGWVTAGTLMLRGG
ncbi:MAG: hypothetical protein AAGF47_03790 [Planctomycetota bacterium]